MKDITADFSAAADRVESWSRDAAHAALDFLGRHIPDSYCDWEPDDESWGRIVFGARVIAFVNARFPLLMVDTRFESAGLMCGLHFKMQTVMSDDFDSKDFRIDEGVLQRFSERGLSPNVSYGALSLNELWWATV